MRTTRRGEAFGQSLGTPIAEASSASDSGTSWIPLEHNRKVQWDCEKDASLDKELEEEHRQSTVELSIPEHRRANQRFLVFSLQTSLPGK